MAPTSSTTNSRHLDTIAKQATEIAKLQIEVTWNQIIRASLESQVETLKTRLGFTFKSLLDVEMASALSLASLTELTDTMSRLCAAVEVIAATATEQQLVDGNLEEMADIFAAFKKSIVDYSEGQGKEYKRLEAEREVTVREFQESMNKHDIKVVLVDQCEFPLLLNNYLIGLT